VATVIKIVAAILCNPVLYQVLMVDKYEILEIASATILIF